MMKKTAQTLATLGMVPLAAFGVNVGGSLGLESGYRSDYMKFSGTQGGSDISEEIKKLNGVSLGINGRLTLNDFYLRGNGGYTWILKKPEFFVTTDSTQTGPTLLEKQHGYNGSGAFGYTFHFNDGEFSLAPEAGYSYDSLLVTTNTTESVASPFVGFDFNWLVTPEWSFGFLFDFHFMGQQNSDLYSGSTKTGKISKTNYMGPEAKVSFDYSFTENWSLGVAYRFKYLFTTKDDVAGFANASQKWMTNNATVQIGYTF